MNESKIKSFTDLKVWQEGHKLVINIYKITEGFPKKEIFCLTNQMRKATISITSNIAESFGRQGYKEKVQFYYLAQGSLIELKNQILIAKDVGYMSEKEFFLLADQINFTHRLLQGFITKSKTFLKS